MLNSTLMYAQSALHNQNNILSSPYGFVQAEAIIRLCLY